MKEDIEVSVIIPVYNGEKYINRCFASIEKQDFEKFEAIVINDGSSDDSLNIIEDFQKRSKFPVQCISQENRGQASARNVGIKAARGRYIAFIDSDDYIKSDYLRTLYCAAEKYDSEVVTCGYCQVDEKGKVLRKAEMTEKSVCQYGKAGMFVVWGKLFNREFLEKYNIRFQEGGKIFEDVPFTISSKFLSNNPIVINYNGYFYVLREGSTMTSSTVKSERFPYEYFTSAVQETCKVVMGEEKQRLEYEVLHFFSGFLFRYCRKAKKKDINDIVKYAQYIIRAFFPEYYKNSFLYSKNMEQTVIERSAIIVFVIAMRLHILKELSVLITRL